MKTYSILSFFCILIIGLYACKNEKQANSTEPSEKGVREIKENYGTGETSRIYQRIDGKIEGKMTDYYPSGALKGERFFKNDLQEGKTTIYFESGKVKEVQYYNNGMRNMGDTIYYEDGKLKYVSEFKDDIKNGYLRKWGEDGALIYEAKFRMDTLIEVGGKPVKQDGN
ncbi:MAG: hypothetical protein U0T36_01930 [Saprospiraceae bacterium]|jgi:antitoxin component YwqK of YwqJK toxin-antitoxin module